MNLFNFTEEDFAYQWNPKDDAVMGGKSDSRFRDGNREAVFKTASREAVFEGDVTTKNFGGFCYVHGPDMEADLSEFEKFEIETRSSGTAFRLLVYTSDRDKSYRSPLIRPAEEYEKKTVPFGDLYPYVWGWKNPFATGFKPENFEAIGFQTEYKSSGEFEIGIKKVDVK